MKLLGQNIESHFVQPFSLKRPDGNLLTFQISPLSLGFQANLRKRGILRPTAPVKISRDSTGRPLRDQQGLALTQADHTDLDYLQKVELHHQRVAVLAIFEALRNDQTISFDATVPSEHTASPTSWTTFADALFQEFEQAGLTPGDLVSFCDEICKLSNMLDQHVQDSQRNFSSQPETNST